MKIVIFELEDWEREAFEQLRKQHDVELLSAPLSRDSAIANPRIPAVRLRYEKMRVDSSYKVC